MNDNRDIADDEKQQQNYEAEVKVYRALEKLDEPIIVLHGLTYTHFRFRIWDSKHNTETCSAKKTPKKSAKKSTCEAPNKTEGEHDFVVMGPDYIVIIEVKNPIKQENINDSVKDARKQFQRAETLVRAIAKKTNPAAESSIKLFKIVAFPNFGQEDPSSVIEKSVNENFSVIYEDHLKNFSSFWNGEIKTSSSCETVCGDIDKIQCVLLRLLANGKTGPRVDESKVSLAECVREIDRKLRDSEITFKSENRPNNPNVWKTSELPLVEGINIFQDCLGLKYITTEQKKAYESTAEHLLISGPSGSGKTLILLARIIRLALTKPESKIAFYVQNSKKLVDYEDIFKSAPITFWIGDESDSSRAYESDSSWTDDSDSSGSDDPDSSWQDVPDSSGSDDPDSSEPDISDSSRPHEPDSSRPHEPDSSRPDMSDSSGPDMSDSSRPHESGLYWPDVQVRIFHQDMTRSFDSFDYLFLDDLQTERVPSDFFSARRKMHGIAMDFNQADFAQKPYSLYGDQALTYLEKFQNIKLEKTYRNTHNIVTQLMTLSKLKKPSYPDRTLFWNQFFHIPSYGHFIHGPQVLVNIYDAGNRLKKFTRRKVVSRVFSEIVTSGGKTSEKNANEACILFNDFSDEEIQFYSQQYPSVLFSNGDYLGNIASTEFTECQIVCSKSFFHYNLNLSYRTISWMLSALKESKLSLSTKTDEMKEKLKLNEPLQLLDETISKLAIVQTGIPLISSALSKEIELQNETYQLSLDFIRMSLQQTIEKLKCVFHESKHDLRFDDLKRLESCMRELTEDAVHSKAYVESLVSMLFNTISRTRVLCRIHLAYDKFCPISKQIAEDFWRKIFPDARIRFINL